jgi:NAD(P)-dependent dehydrogenase (short-subunit alcohol dehydrogenase family)
MKLDIEGKKAWIVGASGTIGSSIASVLAAEGVEVVASGRNTGSLQALVDSIEKVGGKARFTPIDVTIASSVEEAAAQAAGDAQKIDYLVNVTTAPIFGEFLSLDDEAWLAVLNAKLLAYVRTMRAVIPLMQKNGGGSIVNISGRGGRQPGPAHLAGGSANAAINLLTKGIADRFRDDNIRANTVLPGPIHSERALLATKKNAAAGAAQKAAPLGLPEDVAEMVAFLLSNCAKHITGALVPVDGGGTAAI